MTTLSKTAAIAASAAMLTVAVAAPASAQLSNCAPRDTILARLSKTYAEKPVSLGITAKGSLLEVLAGPEGTWSILLTKPNGPTCLVEHGESWQERTPEPDDPLA
ncbi:MAG: hypothetical protein MI920_35965 [Kiloniellales bacterium]|nr:hypothetical protein [Kiloniellales bacterium]